MVFALSQLIMSLFVLSWVFLLLLLLLRQMGFATVPTRVVDTLLEGSKWFRKR